MEHIIDVTIKDKVASCSDARYVCGNSDYVIHFDFDDEWTEFEKKTARFKCEKGYVDVVFSGDVCAVPVITDIDLFSVGVYAGNIHTTTPAYVRAYKSILCGDMGPYDPPVVVPGKDGITPTIGENGNWYLGETDTGKPSRGAKGDKGDRGDKGEKGDTGSQGPKGEKGDKGDTGEAGSDGKSAYAYAVEGGYTGTEAEFTEKLASGALIVTITENNGTLSADKTYTDIYNAILAGTTVLVYYHGILVPLIAIIDDNLRFGTMQCANDDEGAIVGTLIIEITDNGEVNNISYYVEALPNPNALTFTGAVTGIYDGAAEMTVNIPSAVTDEHINSLIDAKLGVIENGSY